MGTLLWEGYADPGLQLRNWGFPTLVFLFSHILWSLAVLGVKVLQFFRFNVRKDLGVLRVQAWMNVLGEKGEARMSVQRVQLCAQLTPFVLWVLLL